MAPGAPTARLGPAHAGDAALHSVSLIATYIAGLGGRSWRLTIDSSGNGRQVMLYGICNALQVVGGDSYLVCRAAKVQDMFGIVLSQGTTQLGAIGQDQGRMVERLGPPDERQPLPEGKEEMGWLNRGSVAALKIIFYPNDGKEWVHDFHVTAGSVPSLTETLPAASAPLPTASP